MLSFISFLCFYNKKNQPKLFLMNQKGDVRCLYNKKYLFIYICISLITIISLKKHVYVIYNTLEGNKERD